MTRLFSRLLPALTWVFYACFVVLWFKDNIDPLKKIRLSSLVAFVPLVAFVGLRLVHALRTRKAPVRFRFDKTALALVLLLILATAVRWPYLLNGERLVNGDDGISALMGKHIAEGRVPPICFYGQPYVGSLSNHVYALFFFLFGYSVTVLKAATFLFYLGFIFVQFLLWRDTFCFTFAVLGCLFYSLPFGLLLPVSVDNSSAHGLILFLGSLILWTATKIAFEKKTSWRRCCGRRRAWSRHPPRRRPGY